MLLAATTVSYLDRQVLGVLAPFLQAQMGWSQLDYSYIVSAFQAAYAIGLLCAGALIDRLGTRIGYTLSIGIWSLAAMGHALAGSVLGFGVARFALGLGEAGNFPAAVKAVAEWFPQPERALATGVFNSGSSIGAILAPALVPLITTWWGWRAAFLLTGGLSALWVIVWLLAYRAPAPRSAPAADPEQAGAGCPSPSTEPGLPWLRLLRYRQAWAFIAAKFLTDPIWWFFLFWLPKFLHARYGLTLLELGPPLIAIFVCADAGSIAGGWLPRALIRRGWPTRSARKTAMLACALLVVPVVLAVKAGNLWTAVALIGLATAGHQGWSANVFTLTSDLFPRRAVASVVGLGGFAGAVSGMMMSTFTGFVLQIAHSYVPMFVIASSAYLVALAVVHALVPRMQPARLDDAPAAAG